MATQLDPNVKDDLKTQFVTREGTYRLLTLSEYSRPNRVGYTNNQSSPQVRVSIVTLPNPPATGNTNSGTNSSSTAIANSSNGAGGRHLTNGSNTQTSGANGGGTVSGDSYDIQSSSSLNGQQSQYVVPSSMDARLGAGMSMHTMMNGSGGIGGLDQNGMPTNQVLGGDRICFNFGRELYVYAFRGVKKVSEFRFLVTRAFDIIINFWLKFIFILYILW